MRFSLLSKRTFFTKMNSRRIFSCITFCFFFFLSLINLSAEENFESITAIILINGSAELVDVNAQGEVLKRHISIPDYFTSGRSHEGSLGKGMKMIDQYGSVNQHMLPGSSNLPSKCLQSYMSAISKKQKQQKLCSNLEQLVSDRAQENLLAESSFARIYMPNSGKDRLRTRKEKSFIHSDLLKYSEVNSSETLEAYVLLKLKFYSAKSKEPLRHRIV